MTRITGERRTKHLKRIGIVLLVIGSIIIFGGVKQYFRNLGTVDESAALVGLVVPLIIGLFVCGVGAIPLLVVRAERKKAESA